MLGQLLGPPKEIIEADRERIRLEIRFRLGQHDKTVDDIRFIHLHHDRICHEFKDSPVFSGEGYYEPQGLTIQGDGWLLVRHSFQSAEQANYLWSFVLFELPVQACPICKRVRERMLDGIDHAYWPEHARKVLAILDGTEEKY